MRIVETGIVVKDTKYSPAFECVGFQHISFCDDKGKWHNNGYAVLQYCTIDDIDKRQDVNLPCLRDGVCIWKAILLRKGMVLYSTPLEEVQLSLDLYPQGAKK